MPHIYLCFLWHMHQPFYKDLITGEYHLPWTRMHALKDYYGMVHLLEEFPGIRQTFNLVPSMMVQVAEYAAGTAIDPYLELALKPAESLTGPEKDFLVKHFFHAYPEHMIYRYPRYAELHEAASAQKGVRGAGRLFGIAECRDLQVLSQLAWFDEEFLEKDPEVKALVAKGRNYSPADQRLMGELQRRIVSAVAPAYHRAAASGQVEISTTPYYHPILPLLCNSSVAGVSHPGVPLPPEFRYPQDALRQLELAHRYIAREFGRPPAGLWPSEGSVSDEVFNIASEVGFRWTATDSGVLARTLGHTIGVEAIYRPYRWAQAGREISVLFRDHFLSDLIGFVYSRMDAQQAADDFVRRIAENCRGMIAAGRDALVPIILDGENAWEYYPRNGRPFLRELYSRISEHPQMSSVTVSEALAKIPPDNLDRIFPGSWINSNFDVWIGAEEDNQAWAHLLRAREVYDTALDVPEDRRRLAYEELLIAEGSDWCWWYGPEHDSANRPEFDRLYRSHLANVYRALGRTPPEELSRPILKVAMREFHADPSGSISPAIDGQETSYFEWLGAGMYQVDDRSGAMHGKKLLVKTVYYGCDAHNFYLRIDFHTATQDTVSALEARIRLLGDAGEESSCVVCFDHGPAHATEVSLAAAPPGSEPAVECAYAKLLEVRIPLAALGVRRNGRVRFQVSLWRGGLPVGALPQHGWLELSTTDGADWSA